MYREWTQIDYQMWLQHVQRMDTKRLLNVATTCTEFGHKQTTKSGYNMYREWTQTDYQMWLQHVQKMDTIRLPIVATTCTEDGHKQSTKSGYIIYRELTQTTKFVYNMYRGWTQTDYQMWLQHVQRMDTNRLPNVATTFTDDGHKQTTNCDYNLYRGWKQTDYQ